MINNKKGVTLISMAITIIVIIILTSIIILSSLDTIDKGNKAVFQNDFTDAVNSLRMYNTEAVLKANNPNYDPELLRWDGESERALNSAKIEDPSQEDKITYILKDHLTKDIKGKVDIIDGKLSVKPEFALETQWALELSKDYARPPER